MLQKTIENLGVFCYLILYDQLSPCDLYHLIDMIDMMSSLFIRIKEKLLYALMWIELEEICGRAD